MRLNSRSQTFKKVKLVPISPTTHHLYLHYLADIEIQMCEGHTGAAKREKGCPRTQGYDDEGCAPHSFPESCQQRPYVL